MMLSPNARKRVALRRGTRVTDTGKLQVAVCCADSWTVQVTVVVPTGNALPVGGAQVVVTGAVAPVTVAPGYVPITGLPSSD